MFTASSQRCTCTCRGKKKLLSYLSSSVKPEKSIYLNFIWVSLLTIRQSQCTAGRMWWDFWALMTVLLEPRLQCRRMFLGSVKLKKLSIVKAWIGSLSLKRRFSVHVCSIQYIKKKNAQLCKSIVWHKDGTGRHFWLVPHCFEEQTVLIIITHSRSTKRRSVTAQELCHHCSQTDWEIRLRVVQFQCAMSRCQRHRGRLELLYILQCLTHSHKHLCASAYFTLLPDSKATPLHISSHMSYTESLWQPD